MNATGDADQAIYLHTGAASVALPPSSPKTSDSSSSPVSAFLAKSPRQHGYATERALCAKRSPSIPQAMIRLGLMRNISSSKPGPI